MSQWPPPPHLGTYLHPPSQSRNLQTCLRAKKGRANRTNISASAHSKPVRTVQLIAMMTRSAKLLTSVSSNSREEGSAATTEPTNHVWAALEELSASIVKSMVQMMLGLWLQKRERDALKISIHARTVRLTVINPNPIFSRGQMMPTRWRPVLHYVMPSKSAKLLTFQLPNLNFLKILEHAPWARDSGLSAAYTNSRLRTCSMLDFLREDIVKKVEKSLLAG